MRTILPARSAGGGVDRDGDGERAVGHGDRGWASCSVSDTAVRECCSLRAVSLDAGDDA